MAEFFLELFSEETPPKLQVNARKSLLVYFNKFFGPLKIFDFRVIILWLGLNLLICLYVDSLYNLFCIH